MTTRTAVAEPAVGRAQFFAAAAPTIRRVLVEHEQRRQRERRVGELMRLAAVWRPMSEAWPGVAADLLVLDAALTRLEALDPRRARIVELRFYGGLSPVEAGEAIGMSATAVEDNLRIAKAWLRRDILADRAGRAGGAGGAGWEKHSYEQIRFKDICATPCFSERS